LATALRELGDRKLRDSGIRQRYAEFFVALALQKGGHTVQILDEREDTSADLYLRDEKLKVEVKSGKCHDDDNWAYASFGKGNQISKKKFDYCVFVTFNCDQETIRDVLVFSRNELEEIQKRRKGVAKHESTNPCIMMYVPNLKDLDSWIKESGKRAFKIERDVHRFPRRFRNAWNKIK
jgi:hypothetical protein